MSQEEEDNEEKLYRLRLVLPNGKVVSMLKCKRCGHEFWPRKNRLPGRCPKCNSPYWMKERTREYYIKRARERGLIF